MPERRRRKRRTREELRVIELYFERGRSVPGRAGAGVGQNQPASTPHADAHTTIAKRNDATCEQCSQNLAEWNTSKTVLPVARCEALQQTISVLMPAAKAVRDKKCEIEYWVRQRLRKEQEGPVILSMRLLLECPSEHSLRHLQHAMALSPLPPTAYVCLSFPSRTISRVGTS